MGDVTYPLGPQRASVPAKAGTERRMRRGALRRAAWVVAVGGLALCGKTAPAAADFRLCNNTASRVGVAVGYKDGQGWTTEGWWNLPSRTCETVLKGNLVARYYYIYAVDYDRGGEWMGQAYMCTRDKEFTIHGITDCLAHGYDRTGFFEVDTGDQRTWTVQLTDTTEQSPSRPLRAGNPLAPVLTAPPGSLNAPLTPNATPAAGALPGTATPITPPGSQKR
jgi:uncharacterized membrane protein